MIPNRLVSNPQNLYLTTTYGKQQKQAAQKAAQLMQKTT